MKSLTIAFSLLIFSQIRLTLCDDETGSQDSEVITPTTPNQIRKAAAAKRNATIQNAKLAFQNEMAEINKVKVAAEDEHDEKLKSVKEKVEKGNIMASTVRRSAARAHARSVKNAKNEYARIIEELKRNVEIIVETAEDEFVKKLAEKKDTIKRILSENQKLLDQVQREIAAEKELALKKREEAEKKYKLGMRNRNTTDEEKEALLHEYEEEVNSYEKSEELLEKKWQKTLDDIGVGTEFVNEMDLEVMQLEEAKKQASLALKNTRQEIIKATAEAKKTLEEKLASAKREQMKAENEAREILETIRNHRKDVAKTANRKYEQVMTLIEAEEDIAETKLNAAINEATKEYENALKKAKEMEISGKKTKFARKNSY